VGRREDTFLELVTGGVQDKTWSWSNGSSWMLVAAMLACVETESGTSRSRILLANCPYEAGTVNSQVLPCNAVPSGWPPCQCSGRPCGMLQSWSCHVLIRSELPSYRPGCQWMKTN